MGVMAMDDVMCTDKTAVAKRLALYREMEANAEWMYAAAAKGMWGEAAKLEVASMLMVVELQQLPEVELTHDEHAEAIQVLDRIVRLDEMTRMVSEGAAGGVPEEVDLIEGSMAIH